ARDGFKCRSVLVKLREVYLILIKVPHLKQRLKATNLMSLFDCKIGNGDNQVIFVMIKRWWPTTHTFHLPCGELGITPRDFTMLTGIGFETGEPMKFDTAYTNYGNAVRIFLDMMPIDYEKGCISFDHLRTYLNHTRVNIKDPANANTIIRAFMLLYFGGVLFRNSKIWARLELGGPIAILENKAYTIDFGSAILKHLYYWLDQASRQEYHCYEYCQIGHHILIDNRLDEFWPRMSAWTLDLEARRLHNESCITHLTVDLRRVEGRLSQLNDNLDGEGIVVDWEDDEGEAIISQAGTSRGRGSRGRGSRGRIFEGKKIYSAKQCCVPYPMNFEVVLDVFIDSSSEEEEEEDIEQSSANYSDDDVIDEIKLEIL
ncbi:hypothetical protein GIB67_010698, partial [Kingdonia uniflora]